MIAYETDYLAHHGVRGMKWGRRKQRVLKGKKTAAQKQYARRQAFGRASNKYVRRKAVNAAGRAGTTAGMIGGIAIAGTVGSILAKSGHLNLASGAVLAAVPIGTAIAGRMVAIDKTYDAVKKKQPKY